MKLSEFDKRLINYLFFHGKQSAAEIARSLGSKEPTVRRTAQKLIAAEVIYPVPYVSQAVLGHTMYQAFLRMPRPVKEQTERLLSFLQDHEQVVWVSGVGAHYRFDVMLLASAVSEVATFLNSIGDELEGVECESTIAAQTSFTYYPPRYLDDKEFSPTHLVLAEQELDTSLDETDHQILKALSSISDFSTAKVAKELSIPASTVSYRLQQLEARHVIRGYGYMVRPFAVGVSPFIYLLHTKTRSSKVLERLHEFALADRNITFLIENIGEWDYQLGARFFDAHESTACVERLYESFGDVLSDIKVLPVLESAKYDAYPAKSS